MARIFFDVIPNGGDWMVKIEGDSGEWRFDRRADAIHSAIAAARRHWTDTGKSTGVRIRQATGTWKRECVFGKAPRRAAPPA
jgi:hypothetical protein